MGQGGDVRPGIAQRRGRRNREPLGASAGGNVISRDEDAVLDAGARHPVFEQDLAISIASELLDASSDFHILARVERGGGRGGADRFVAGKRDFGR
jgi:hypothetical protein